MNKETAKEKLLNSFYRLPHGPGCIEGQPYFEDENVGERYPHDDGCLTIKCHNCHVAQDHFLYSEDQ